MKVIIARDYSEQCSAAADIIEGIVRAKPDCCLGLATGSSPVGMYKELARRCAEEGLDFSRVHSVNLDEYIGLAPEHDQSYRYFMNSNLFDHINIDKANTYVAGGIGDVDAGIAEFNAVIERSDVDVQVLGVGPDGHLGFNEPGSVLHADAHREKLDESTIDANARFFASRDDVPRYAVTMGMGGIMKARKLLLIISGSKDDAAKKLRRDHDGVPRHLHEAAPRRRRYHRAGAGGSHRLQRLNFLSIKKALTCLSKPFLLLFCVSYKYRSCPSARHRPRRSHRRARS